MAALLRPEPARAMTIAMAVATTVESAVDSNRRPLRRTAGEAVTRFRALAGSDPAAEPDLTSALNTVAGALSRLGLYEDGLDPATEAVERARPLAARTSSIERYSRPR